MLLPSVTDLPLQDVPFAGAARVYDEEVFSAMAHAQSVAAGATGAQAGRPSVDAFGWAPPALCTDELACPHCGRTVAACRFAPHVEKCLGKGRNAQRAATKRGA